MKLILINNHFYIINNYEQGINPTVKFFDDKVDDNSIFKTSDFDDNPIYLYIKGINHNFRTAYKITHSTKNIEGVINLNIQDIEELVYGYNLNNMSYDYTQSIINMEKYGNFNISPTTKFLMEDSFIQGFKSCQNIMKEKLFTINETIEFTMNMISQYTQGNTNIFNRNLLKESIKTLSKNEWNITIDSNNKIIILN